MLAIMIILCTLPNQLFQFVSSKYVWFPQNWHNSLLAPLLLARAIFIFKILIYLGNLHFNLLQISMAFRFYLIDQYNFDEFMQFNESIL